MCHQFRWRSFVCPWFNNLTMRIFPLVSTNQSQEISTNQSKSWKESVWLTIELKFDFLKWPQCRATEINVIFRNIFLVLLRLEAKRFAINPIDCNAMQFISFICKVFITIPLNLTSPKSEVATQCQIINVANANLWVVDLAF